MPLVLTHHEHDPRAFRARVIHRLLEAEAENCVQVGLVDRLAAHGYAPVSPDERDRPLLITVADDGGRLNLVAIQTLTASMLVTRGSPEGLRLLADHLAAGAVGRQHGVGVVPSIATLVDRYATAAGRRPRLAVRLRAFSLSSVTPPPPTPGRMRPCTVADRQTLAAFVRDFEAEIGLPSEEDAPSRADRFIAAGRLFVWEDAGRPVAMAGWAGPTPDGVRVNCVYTPPAHRRRGYATALVAALSQHLLATGRRSCFLFTDLANPTSNAIYQRIGYRPVSDAERWTFDTPV